MAETSDLKGRPISEDVETLSDSLGRSVNWCAIT